MGSICFRPINKEDFPDKEILDVELRTWKMYFDRAVNQYGNGIEILLIKQLITWPNIRLVLPEWKLFED